jgi:hypothetical protein
MDEKFISQYILSTYDGVQVVDDEENAFFFYDAENRIPFVTIIGSNKYDTYSDLDRSRVYRLNIGIGKQTFRSMFPVEKIPTESGYDFSALDTLMPHPEYGRMYWVCILNPSESTFEKVRPMLGEAYEIAVKKYNAAQSATGKPRRV